MILNSINLWMCRCAAAGGLLHTAVPVHRLQICFRSINRVLGSEVAGAGSSGDSLASSEGSCSTSPCDMSFWAILT